LIKILSFNIAFFWILATKSVLKLPKTQERKVIMELYQIRFAKQLLLPN